MAETAEGVSLVSVVFPAASLDQAFTYRLPETSSGVPLGHCVRAPLGRAVRRGWVVGPGEPFGGRILEVEWVSPESAFGPRELELFSYTASRWGSPLGAVLKVALPAGWRPPGPPRGEARPRSKLELLEGYRGARAFMDAVEGDGGGKFILRPHPGHNHLQLAAEAASLALSRGKGVLVLQAAGGGPEVQEAARILPGALLHSCWPRKRREEAWWQLARGEVRLGVGSRAAAFAPVRDLGLVVVLDEENPAYLEERSPRFDAVEVVRWRAERERAVFLSITPTPRLGSWLALDKGEASPITPDPEEERRGMPAVELVPSGPDGRSRILRALKGALAAGIPAVVVAWPKRAEKIARWLESSLRQTPLSSWEPGPGLYLLSPADAYTARPDGKPRVVAVVEAEATLERPEYTAAEEAVRWWWRWARAAGRRGRGGRLMLEVADSSHPAIRALVSLDLSRFAREELARRRELSFPPWVNLVQLELAGTDKACEKILHVLGEGVAGPFVGRKGAIYLARTNEPAALLDRVRRAAVEAGVELRVSLDPVRLPGRS